MNGYRGYYYKRSPEILLSINQIKAFKNTMKRTKK